jgi:hypothetical protein
MHGHLLRAEIDPLDHVERLPIPAPHRFKQIGNPRFMDLRFSGGASEFRGTRNERAHSVTNSAPGLVTPTATPVCLFAPGTPSIMLAARR